VSQRLHQPVRPGWTCEDCGRDWPCEAARSRLTAETGGGTRLAVLMWCYLEDFCGDDLGRSAGTFDRFVGWTRRPCWRAAPFLSQPAGPAYRTATAPTAAIKYGVGPFGRVW